MNQATKAARITRIDYASMVARRTRFVCHNAFSGPHGDTVTEPIARLHTSAGVVGWARANVSPDLARMLVGKKVEEVFSLETGAAPGYDLFDTALWDLVGRLEEKSVHGLLGYTGSRTARVYDSATYFQDLDPVTNADRGLDPITEALEKALAAGYRECKLKIGRGDKWMERSAGFRRDVEVIHRAREVVGPGTILMIDSNNAYTFEEACELVRQVRECNIYWFEEPFPEDVGPSLAFKEFLHAESPEILLADGEGTRPCEREIRAVLRASAIDIVQFDFRPVPINAWLPALPFLRETGVATAPHNWSSYFLNYYVPHFGMTLPGFTTAETDPCTMEEIDPSGYRLVDGKLEVPDTPGFGLEADHAAIDAIVAERGWTISG